MGINDRLLRVRGSCGTATAAMGMNRSSSQVIGRSVVPPSHPIARTRSDDHSPSAGLSLLPPWAQQILGITDGQSHLTIPGHGVGPMAGALFTAGKSHRFHPLAWLV